MWQGNYEPLFVCGQLKLSHGLRARYECAEMTRLIDTILKLLAGAFAWFKIDQSARRKAEIDGLEADIATDKRMDDAETTTDPAVAREMLEARAKRIGK